MPCSATGRDWRGTAASPGLAGLLEGPPATSRSQKTRGGGRAGRVRQGEVLSANGQTQAPHRKGGPRPSGLWFHLLVLRLALLRGPKQLAPSTLENRETQREVWGPGCWFPWNKPQDCIPPRGILPTTRVIALRTLPSDASLFYAARRKNEHRQ